ncbi:hypothetical protein [Pseudomonas lactis]|uniref:hypothetical protein n=1 Tax=Pseudomonas lactis TaxID=1615674 RepID=UPI00190C66B1|nr:hypothetical protein [Pseudomonas lactis]MBK3444121.1 hypothetical protein [Pseudomonas lactis]
MSITKAEADYFAQVHVHTVDDGRGAREVYLDGVKVGDAVCCADTQLGLVVAAYHPLEIMPGTDNFDGYHAWGEVRVVPKLDGV